jgi:hypothetical protein
MNVFARLLALWAMWRRVIARREVPATVPPEPDPREREVFENDRAELLAAVGLFASAGFAIAFIVLYVVYPNTPLMGATAGLSLVSLAAALMYASLRVVPQVTAVEDRGALDHGPRRPPARRRGRPPDHRRPARAGRLPHRVPRGRRQERSRRAGRRRARRRERHAPQRAPRRLVAARVLGLLEDLHARGLRGLAVPLAREPVDHRQRPGARVPVPLLDLRRHARR